jgi:signal transduction histidine kinase
MTRARAVRALSLRARMLALLIAVTAAFLLIVGAVSTLVLYRQQAGQFRDGLIAEASRMPAEVAASPGGYAAAMITFRPFAVTPLTSGPVTQELTAALTGLGRVGLAQLRGTQQPFTVPVASGPALAAAARLIRAQVSGVAGIQLSRIRGVLVVAQPTSAITARVRAVVLAELITGGALLALLAIGGRWLIGRGLAPLDRMATTADAITAGGDLTTRMPGAGGGTEVGRLSAAINTMLDRIEQAFRARLRSEQKVREFAADASHELRTPLTTIRGYAELYRQGALGPGQVPDAMRRIEQEAGRMGTLVAELLELARLDRTSSLDLAETDLAQVVRDAAADASAVEPARPIRVHAPPSLVATVDEARVRQVLANLLANVRTHTPVNAAVTVTLAAAPAAVLIEVADAGPGMSPADAERAFDRFHRGVPPDAGQQEMAGAGPAGTVPGGSPAEGPPAMADSGGSGLGLSIVQAIARAHGGRATLESRPGHGTRVCVWLPQRAAAT